MTIRKLSMVTLPLLATLALSACGDGGGVASAGSVAPIPSPTPSPQPTPPATPLAPTPALTAGTYDTIAVAEAPGIPAHGVANGVLRLTVEAGNKYTLTYNPAMLPEMAVQGAPDGTRTFQLDPKFGTSSFVNSGGGSGDAIVHNANGENFGTAIGASHVSLGVWTLTTSNGNQLLKDVVFAYGDRTPAAAIPASGTATYRMNHLTGNSYVDEPDYYNIQSGPDAGKRSFTLIANFGSKSIGADIVRTDNDYITRMSGSGPILPAGNFDITLAGSIANGATSVPANGSISGAFFGPSAGQLGGTLLMPWYAGGLLVEAFVAERQ